MLANIFKKQNPSANMTLIVGLLVTIVTITNFSLSTAFPPERQHLFNPSTQNGSKGLFEGVGDNESESLLLQTPEESLEVSNLKREFIELADRTNRGFTASAADKKKANDLVRSLKLLQTISDPARTYYDPSATSSVSSGNDGSKNSISGKWTLIYTDAPDITGLDTSRNPFSTAKLGRIGQECTPPYIKNVIE